MSSAKHILLVEDSETQALRLQLLFAEQGWQTERASTGEDAIGKLGQIVPDLIILDHYLPGLKGVELCKLIRLNATGWNPPILMFTADYASNVQQESLESGADDYLSKSVEDSILLLRVRALLRKSATNRSIASKGGTVLRQARLLAVDDSPSYLEYLVHELSDDGHAVETAGSGPEALQKIKAGAYDCVVLDLVMPDMDGIQVCGSISAMAADLSSQPVVLMLTGNENAVDMARGLESGADDFVGKSSDVSILKARVRALVRRKLFQDALKDKEIEILRLDAAASREQWRRSSEELQAQIYARKEAEEKMTLLAAIESLPQMVWAAAPDGNIDYYNERWHDYTGMNFEQSKALGWQPVVHPDDFEITMERWTHAFTTCDPFEVEARLKHALDSEYRWHLSRALPIRNANGVVTRWFGTCTDIEDFKQAQKQIEMLNEGLEERVRERTAELVQVNGQLAEANESLRQAERSAALLAAIIASSDDAIVSETLEGVITSWNAGAERLFGHTAGEGIGRHVGLIIPPEDLEREARLLERLRESESVEHLEATRLHKSGQTVQVSVTLSPVRDASGQIIGASQILRDVSERLRAQEEILELNRRLKTSVANAEAANRAKSTFLSTMSHEIRTPLNAIVGYAQLMSRDSTLSADAKTNLTIMSRSGEHLLTLINAVLDMSKIESGRTEVNATPFDLSALLADLAAMFRLRAETKGLHFDMEISGEAALYLVADEGKIRQALINLLGNAIKFTQRGYVKLHVHVDQRIADSLWLSCTVEDTGVGLTDEDQKKLFEPFTQGKGELNTEQGTGLGLAISRQFARLMGGDITVVTRPGEGCLFRFEIPVTRGSGRAPVKWSAARRVTGIRAGTTVPRILIVDDQTENRDWLQKLLTVIGFSVGSAENGETAICRWQDWQPQMILMDIHMPVMDGLEATRRIKADPQGNNTFVVALTASVLEEDRRVAFESGADAFLTKPCREDELLDTIRTLLKIDYAYEHEAAGPDLLALNAAALAQLPTGLAEEMRRATSDGNKKLLDKLITQVRESDRAGCADALQDLVDKYEYDTLTRVLEEVCHR